MKDKIILIFCFLWSFVVLTGCSKDDVTEVPEESKSDVQADIPQVDNAITDFMNAYSVPGVSVAIAKNDKLVYVKSYGLADKEENKAVTNKSLFRLASISKTITSVAVMKLLEDGKLSLKQTVFGENGILGTTYGTLPYGQYIKEITVEQLLHHTCGGWGNNSNDPMFMYPSMSQAELISWTLGNLPLAYKPGTHYDYSNFGYCVLGRVIEKLSGQAYEQYVQKNILEPIGISDMQIAGNTLAERKSNEVVYYGQGGENPYNYNVARMDSHGGWISSATDLARLVVYIDGFNGKPDILSSSTIKTLTTPSVVYANYACGIAVNSNNNWWHSGSIPGTFTEFVRASNGFCWVILCNTRNTAASFGNAFDAVIWKAVNDNTTVWQNIDQF
ncbi:MAG: serine hydrolase domain-containing protein [Draconibacterium sp.]